MREAFVETSTRLLDEVPHLVVTMADISVARFGDAIARHPSRVVNVGIREQTLIGVTAGLALEGLRPIAHSYTPFLIERPFEQVKLDLTHNDVGAVLVSTGASYDATAEGRTHQSPGDVSLLDTLSEWTVYIPGHPAEVAGALRIAARGRGRYYIRLAEQTNSDAFNLNEGFEVVKRGQGGTVIAVGPMLDHTLTAVEGLDLTVLYASRIRPFDSATMTKTLHEPAVVLVEPYLAGTSAKFVAEALSHLPARILSLGVPNIENRHYGTAEEHDEAHGLSAAGLRHRIGAFIDATGTGS